MGLAQSYTGVQDYEQAEASYRQLLALDSSNSEGYRELAELYIRLEKLEEAKALLEEAINNTDDEELQDLWKPLPKLHPSLWKRVLTMSGKRWESGRIRTLM